MVLFSQILILFLLYFSTPTLEHQFTSYQLSPACDFSITREQRLSHTSFLLTDECKWEKGHGQLQYHFTNHSHVIPGESIILNNINVCYKLSKLTCINVESHYINAVFVIYLLYLLWHLCTIHIPSQQILIYIKYLLWAKHCSIYPLTI